MARKFPIKGLALPLCLAALVLTGCGSPKLQEFRARSWAFALETTGTPAGTRRNCRLAPKPLTCTLGSGVHTLAVCHPDRQEGRRRRQAGHGQAFKTRGAP
jgi:hypothetical protein